ncbi:MAG: hypothetical protein WCX46_04675 [Candidatus Paceibacterota bacterium]
MNKKLQEILKILGISNEVAASFIALIITSSNSLKQIEGEDKEEEQGKISADDIQNMAADFLSELIDKKGKEIAKKYIELQTKRIEAIIDIKPETHKKTLDELEDFLTKENEKQGV